MLFVVYFFLVVTCLFFVRTSTHAILDDLNNYLGVSYILSTRNQMEKKLDLLNINEDKLMIVIIHGWTENPGLACYLEMTQEFLKKYDCNVIRVDWSSVASQQYMAVCDSLKDVGETIGNLLVHLNVSLSKLHIIGHSLGGHVAGFTGKTIKTLTGDQIAKITALDPAGPLFTNPYKRLSKTDAKVVVVVHTDGKMFGYNDSLGTIDFYPNGGTAFQPGCSVMDFFLSQNFWCSHQKSVAFFTESVNHVKYVATKCESWTRYKSGSCDANEKLEFAEDTPDDAGGSYYFKTYE